jgi:putative PIN family toxin of toxin-antitoxin system
MRCLLDTNVLVSAALFPNSVPAQAYMKAVTPPGRAVVCDYSLEEMQRVFTEKFPDRLRDYEDFASAMRLSVEIIFTPPGEDALECENKIRDVKDRPILRAAMAAHVDVIITGDKDFLEAGLAIPAILTSAEFLSRRER